MTEGEQPQAKRIKTNWNLNLQKWLFQQKTMQFLFIVEETWIYSGDRH